MAVPFCRCNTAHSTCVCECVCLRVSVHIMYLSFPPPTCAMPSAVPYAAACPVPVQAEHGRLPSPASEEDAQALTALAEKVNDGAANKVCLCGCVLLVSVQLPVGWRWCASSTSWPGCIGWGGVAA